MGLLGCYSPLRKQMGTQHPPLETAQATEAVCNFGWRGEKASWEQERAASASYCDSK